MSPKPAQLPERDVHYLKLLKTLKTAQGAGGGEGQLGVVRRIADWIDSLPVLNFICKNAGWYDDWGVKEALLHNDLTPQRWRLELDKQVAIFELLREMDAPDLSSEERAEIQEDLKDLFKTLTEHDRAVVKQRAYSLSKSRRPDEPASETEAGGAGSVAEAPAPPDLGEEEEAAIAAEWAAAMQEAGAEEGDGLELVLDDEEEAALQEDDVAATEAVAVEEHPAEALDVEPPPEASEWAGRDVGERVAAAGSADAGTLAALVHDGAEEVQLALVANPALADGPAAVLARKAGPRVADAIYRERRLFMRPLVQAALMDCAHAPATALLEIVNGFSDVPGLMRLLRSPKIKHLEVKAKARHRLATVFRALGPNEKMAALRRGGRGMIKELWTDFFRDEVLVLKCIREKQIDSGTALEIARSSIAPRKALEAMSQVPQYVSNYQVTLQLVMNPKTPRQVVTRLIRKLNPADRRMVKNNPALPASVRGLA